jgi:CRISPR-associated protein Csd1
MGLLQKAVETYDAHQALAGKIEEGHTPLAPVGHTITSASIEITLDASGNMISATTVEKDDAKIIIPVTEESSGRTSGIAAHPLCEQIGYLSGQDEKKYNQYVEQLSNWETSKFTHPMLTPILKYVKSKTIINDLHSQGITKDDAKQLVRWRVEGIGTESGPCWTNQNLFKCFYEWYTWACRDPEEKEFCMISGEDTAVAKQHPKGIIPINGNAKLISANDSANFTYRGRFTDEQQAASVSYVASQKAHNALRWLAAEQGVIMGGRTFICWNPQGKSVPRVDLPFIKSEKTCVSPTDYRKELLDTLSGWKTELPETRGVVIASFDAATTGRLSLTYYNELIASDFLERIHDWDETCCWWSWNSEERRYNAVRSPSLYKIVNSAFGVQRIDKDKKAKLITDDRILKQQIQRLLACRIDRALFPADMERLLVNRASAPQAFEQGVYNGILITACAVIRKYHHDCLKEEIAMSLEKDHRDRSYQFGRLLAVMDKAERDTYDRDEKRETNASKMQSVFCQHPLHVAKNIEAQLERAYFPRLSSGKRAYYKQLIGEIFEKISQCPENEWNRPLGDLYLIGYYLQRNELYKSKDNMVKDNISEEEEK